MNILQKVQKESEKHDLNEVYIALLREGLSPSIAWQLCKGTYKHKLAQRTVVAIEAALKKVG